MTVSPENLERVRTVVAEAEAAGAIEGDWAVRFGPKPRPDQPQVYTMYVVQKTPLISGEGLRKAVAMPDQQSASGSWQILFENSPESAQKFGEITQAHLQEAMAIVVDDVVVSAPTIQAKITTGGTITGSFTMEEAKDLSIALESGSMPVPVREDYVGVVSASLGNEAIQSGITSSVLGVIAVCIFMIAYYHIGGIIAIISLIANGMLLLAALSYINATLTLPGIAGMMLTLGMAVDANVLIYERLREEFRLGKSLASSVEAAFSRASSAIIDSNVTTLIAAAVLMEFGTGPVEGFAVALSIGIFTSVFTAVVLSKVMFDFVVARRPAGKLSMLSVFKEQTNIPFMGMRYKAYVISAIMIAVGLGYFAFRGNENFGVDFRTGTNLTVGVGANAEVPVESVREALASAGFNSPTVQGLGENAENRFLLRLAEIDAAISSAEQQAAGQSDAVQNTVASRVQKALAPLVSADAAPEVVTLENVQTVGPAVSNQLKIDTMWAILYSLIFIGLYMWYRFDWKYAVGGILALLHDTFITVGLLALTQREVSLTVVAAILTVIGYSLNDTIVVYDRIREDLRLYRGRGYTLAQIMDISINQTLSRTILTSLCTLFVVTVLFFYGGPVLNDFAFVLAVGIIVGTFSSIFVASPFVLMLEKVNIGRGKKAEGSEEPKQGGGRHRRGTRRSSEAETV